MWNASSVSSRHASRRLIVVGVFLGLLALLRGLAGVAYAGRVYPGVQVVGADLGGQTVDQAAATLQARLGAYEQVPVDVHVGDRRFRLKPGELGLRPDVRRMAQAAYDVGRQGGLLVRLVGPVVASRLASEIASDSAIVDAAAVESAVGRIAAAADRPTVNAELSLTPQLALKPSQSGQWLDQAKAREEVRHYLGTFGSGPLVLTVRTEEPRVTTEQLEPVRARAERILGRSVILADGQRQWPVPTSTVLAALVLRTDPFALDVRPEAFAGIVADVARQVDRPARDATLTIAGGKVQVNPEEAGRKVDQSATLAALRDRLLSDGSGAAVVSPVSAVVEPALKASDLRPVADEAQALIDRGLVLTVEKESYRVSGSELGDMLVVGRGASGRWNISLSREQVEQLVARVNEQFRHPSLDARFAWENGKVRPLQQPVPAVAVDQPRAVASILSAWRDGKVDLPTVASEMSLDAAYLERLNQDLKGIIQERSISFAGSIPERAHNISLALSRINGTLVLPGQTFSFNRAVGPVTLDAGFRWGFAYSTEQGASKVVPSVAGGICQVSTTVFQPVFWAGYQIEERHWHMFAMKHYADRGYVGLDATVYPGAGLDFQFTNNTDHALLILAGTKGQATYVALVGTKPDWTVRVDPEVITDVQPAPKEVVRTTSPLFARGREILLEEAQEGLTSHVVRHVISPDGRERTLRLVSDYQPAPRSILIGTG